MVYLINIGNINNVHHGVVEMRQGRIKKSVSDNTIRNYKEI